MSAAAYSRVWEIYGMLHPRPDDLISTSRYFVREGDMIIWDEKKKKKKKRYFFLFNDILLLCRRENHKRYWLRIHITLRSPYVSIEDVENASYNNEFRLHCRSRYFILYALTSDLRKDWITDLQRSIAGTHPDEKNNEKKEEKKDEKKTEREDEKKYGKTKQDANRSKTATDKKKIRRDDDESQDDSDSPDSEEEQEVVPKKKKETKAPKSARTKSTGDKATKKMIKKKEPVSSGAGDLHSFDPFIQNPNLNQNPNRAQTPNPFGAGAPGYNNPFLSGNASVPTSQQYQSLPFAPFGQANAIGSIGGPPVGNYGGVGGVGGGFGPYATAPGFTSPVTSPGFTSPVNPYIDSSSGVGYPQQPSHLVVNPFVQQPQPQPFAVQNNQANNPFAPVSPRANNPFTQNPQQYNNPF